MKKFILSISIIFFFIGCKEEPIGFEVPVEWEKIYGGEDFDRGYSVCQTSDKGYIIVGETMSFGAGSYDVYLIKTDEEGNEEWSKTYGGSSTDFGFSVQQTSDGGYIISGETFTYGVGAADVYLIKTNTSGNEEWSKTFGFAGNYWSGGKSVKQTSNGGYIITGWVGSSSTGDEDIYLIKTDVSGNEEWSRTLGGSNYDVGNSIDLTEDGGFIIAGNTISYGAGGSDIYLIKTNSSGDTLWTKTFGGSGSDKGYSVQQTSDRGYIIAGETNSYGAGGYDLYLIKTDEEGNEEWSRTYGGEETDSQSDVGNSVQQTSDGGYIVIGNTWSFDAKPGEGNIYLVKTDGEGNIEWEGTVDNTDDRGYGVQQTSDGKYIVVGSTWPSGAGHYSVYLVKID